jgi:CRISPR-associated endonuclease/helicase Cas3
MSEQILTASDFDAYFEALWNKTPFPWQTALARRLLGEDPNDAPGTWPEAITLPTASGKTACIDIAIFALAAQTPRQEKSAPLTTPRRIFFVVDRRVIVDEAFDRARCLEQRLALAEEGILGEVAERLRRLAGGDKPLACFQLRGGIYRNDAWARSPIQPTVICSTVDQVGSRLLFRAYGRSFKAWPLQAGLAGNDALILLDEAHCARPFMDTLHAVEKYRLWAEQPLPAPFQVVSMTATPPAELTPFPDPVTAEADRAHPVLKRRLEAAKPCRLEVAEKAKGKDAVKTSRTLATKLVEEAERLITDYANAMPESAGIPSTEASSSDPAVAIFCNRVATARAVSELLHKQGRKALLLTGRMRPLDRDQTLAGPLAQLDAAKAEARRLAAPLFVAATQTLEVGANLDFDLMVTECADLPALRQRFGRLNRMGRPIPARGVIVVRADQTETQDGDQADPVYGNALPETWQWLLQHRDPEGLVDMGVSSLAIRLPQDLSKLTAEAKQAPVLLPSHLDALAQTAPVPLPSPDPGLFLHGPQAGPADVQICWRADLDPGKEVLDREAWLEAIALCPPAAGELMPVPFAAFRRWTSDGGIATDTGDVGSVTAEENAPATGSFPAVVRWPGHEDAEVIDCPEKLGRIRPGDIVVVPASLGGWDTLGHKPGDSPADRGEEAHLRARSRAMLRLHPDVLAGWPALAPDVGERFAQLAQEDGRLEDEPELFADELREALWNLVATIQEQHESIAANKQSGDDWLLEIAQHLAEEPHLDRCIKTHPCGGLVVVSRRRVAGRARAISDFSHEDDSTASGTASREIKDHLEGVADLARRFTGHLPPKVAEDISLAALCHDLGKADPRFQALLHGGNPWVRGPLLAKSGAMPQGRAAFERALHNSGYPKGGRHELLSVRLIESAPDLLGQAHDPELVLHLVASHHGYCRPFAPVVVDPNSREVSLDFQDCTLSADSATGLERLDSGVAERFWSLVRRYGWWGLAGLEATLMLSDHRRSESEETESDNA